jgi:hypothetical protein
MSDRSDHDLRSFGIFVLFSGILVLLVQSTTVLPALTTQQQLVPRGRDGRLPGQVDAPDHGV